LKTNHKQHQTRSLETTKGKINDRKPRSLENCLYPLHYYGKGKGKGENDKKVLGSS
jgi:hypothetical protein